MKKWKIDTLDIVIITLWWRKEFVWKRLSILKIIWRRFYCRYYMIKERQKLLISNFCPKSLKIVFLVMINSSTKRLLATIDCDEMNLVDSGEVISHCLSQPIHLAFRVSKASLLLKNSNLRCTSGLMAQFSVLIAKWKKALFLSTRLSIIWRATTFALRNSRFTISWALWYPTDGSNNTQPSVACLALLFQY